MNHLRGVYGLTRWDMKSNERCGMGVKNLGIVLDVAGVYQSIISVRGVRGRS